MYSNNSDACALAHFPMRTAAKMALERCVSCLLFEFYSELDYTDDVNREFVFFLLVIAG